MEEKLRQANAATAEGKKDGNDKESDKLKAELETLRKNLEEQEQQKTKQDETINGLNEKINQKDKENEEELYKDDNLVGLKFYDKLGRLEKEEIYEGKVLVEIKTFFKNGDLRKQYRLGQ